MLYGSFNSIEEVKKNIIEVNKFEKSELLKLFDNTYRDINFSIGNEFGRISNKLGLSGEEII